PRRPRIPRCRASPDREWIPCLQSSLPVFRSGDAEEFVDSGFPDTLTPSVDRTSQPSTRSNTYQEDFRALLEALDRVRRLLAQAEFARLLGQEPQAAAQPPLRRRRRDAEHLGGLRLRHPVDPHQVEDLPLSSGRSPIAWSMR